MSDKIISRVRKMLALAHDSGAAENERDNALRMAHATLAKHNLSMGELELKGEATEERVREHIETRGWAWTPPVAQSIATLFFCEGYFTDGQGSRKRHYFVGKTSNVITAQEIAAFVIESIVREANARKRQAGEQHGYFLSFCKGAALAVRNRCYDLREAAEKESKGAAKTPGTSLVLASVYQTEAAANAAFLADLGTGLKKQKSRERDAGRGYGAGLEFGGTIPLHKQVSSGRRQLT